MGISKIRTLVKEYKNYFEPDIGNLMEVLIDKQSFEGLDSLLTSLINSSDEELIISKLYEIKSAVNLLLITNPELDDF